MTEFLKLGDRTFSNRLLVGTAKYPNNAMMLEALIASGTELVTVSIRRIDINAAKEEGGILDLVSEKFTLLPNTAGCYTAKDAIFTANLSREALGTNLIKLEVIGDDKTLLPDSEELLRAARELVADGFDVMPYCNDDPILCMKLADAGCVAVMPLGSPIGSGAGIRNPYNFRIIRERVKIPIIVDAGIGTASEAAFAMELGCDGVLLNSAISGANDPVRMARAFRNGVLAGRDAYLAGRIPMQYHATPSSPTTGLVQS